MPKPWKCNQCKHKLGSFCFDHLHVQKQVLEAILRVQGGITLICPECGALNEICIGKEKPHGQLSSM